MKSKHKIYVPQAALEETIRICSNELHDVYEKQNQSLTELLFRFVRIDLQFYLKVAFTGLGGTIMICLMSDSSTVPFSIYAGILGSLNLYECYKSRSYQTTELCTPVYLNQGKVFLLKNASIAILEIFIFVIYAIFAKACMQLSTMSIILSSLLPLFLCQILIMHFFRYIHHVYEAFVLYILMFGGYMYVYYVFEATVLSKATPIVVICLFIILFSFFIHDLYKIKNIGKGDIYGIIGRAS